MLNGVVLEWLESLILTDRTFQKQKSNDCDNELDPVELIFMQFDLSHVRERLVVFFCDQYIWQESYKCFLLITPGKGWASLLREIIKALKLNVATEFG